MNESIDIGDEIAWTNFSSRELDTGVVESLYYCDALGTPTIAGDYIRYFVVPANGGRVLVFDSDNPHKL